MWCKVLTVDGRKFRNLRTGIAEVMDLYPFAVEKSFIVFSRAKRTTIRIATYIFHVNTAVHKNDCTYFVMLSSLWTLTLMNS